LTAALSPFESPSSVGGAVAVDRLSKKTEFAMTIIVCDAQDDRRAAESANRLGRAVLTEARYWSIALAYLVAYVIAVYDRIPISDWLTAHLPL
jgi:hypothetical protein